MAVTTATPTREYEKPMSWARAVAIATGFFFLTAILTGQLPSYVYTVSTLATLSRFEQGFLDMGLLAVGIGALCLELSLLYDPKPVIPGLQFLFALVGLGIAAIGLLFVYQVGVSSHGAGLLGAGWGRYLPDTLGQTYLFNPAWFQSESIDIAAIGMIGLLVGLGMFSIGVLNPVVLSGALNGALRSLLVRLSFGVSLVILALAVTFITFAPQWVADTAKDEKGKPTLVPYAIDNILLFAALSLALFGLLVWLLPIMVSARQQFMPGVYLHGVIGLLGNIGVPLLIVWALAYPIVNLVHKADSQQFWVVCSQKTNIPGSCTFSQYTGYIITTIVFSIAMGLLIMGLYFWSTRRNTVVLGGTIGILFLAVAATVIHTDDPLQLPVGLIIATGIAVLAFAWTWATQREFAPTTPQQLGCVGQWLVLGTLLLLYLFGFAFFSLPNFFESESLALFYQPGQGGLHDAIWGLLLMGGLAALQLTFLVRRRPLSNIRKFALWVMLVGVALEIVGGVIGFHDDVLKTGINGMEGGHAVFVTGLCFEVVGFAAALIGAIAARGLLSAWTVAIAVVAFLGIAFAIVIYNLPTAYPELVIFGIIAASVGAFAYTAAGPDPEEEFLGEDGEPFVVAR